MTIKEEILKAKINGPALVDLIERFAPLLKKYASKLLYEDAYADLQLKFIEMILKFNPDKMRSDKAPYILSYISRSIYNHYIYLSKQERLEQLVSPMSAMGNRDGDNSEFWDRLCPPSMDDYLYDEFDFLYKNLTFHEANIIIMIYYLRFTVQETAKQYGVSPSAICQAKSNGIKKLKKKYERDN